jgi:hypothetical protein
MYQRNQDESRYFFVFIYDLSYVIGYKSNNAKLLHLTFSGFIKYFTPTNAPIAYYILV